MVKLVSISQALLVAEHLSFSRAAQVLGIQQSAVSRRVRALEDKLGVSLFERDASGIRLTEAGRRFFDRSRSALAEIDHAVKAAANAGCGAEGALRIGILSSLSGGFVRELLGAYRETHPAIAIDIVEGSASEHLARISERLLDIAFVAGTSSAPHCDTIVLWEARVFAVLPARHRLADEDTVGWEALKDENFIVSRDAPGCTRAAALACLTRTVGSPGSGGALPPGKGFNWPGSGSGLRSSTICTGPGRSV